MMLKRDIRPATLADLALMHEWVNADDSLKWKKDTKHVISREEHTDWIQSCLADPVTQIWIILDDDAPSGQVRLEKKGDLVYVDIYVVAGARGQGIASAALECAIANYKSAHGNHVFFAIVHVENKSSQKLFIKSRFNPIESGDADWLKYIRSEG